MHETAQICVPVPDCLADDAGQLQRHLARTYITTISTKRGAPPMGPSAGQRPRERVATAYASTNAQGWFRRTARKGVREASDARRSRLTTAALKWRSRTPPSALTGWSEEATGLCSPAIPPYLPSSATDTLGQSRASRSSGVQSPADAWCRTDRRGPLLRTAPCTRLSSSTSPRALPATSARTCALPPRHPRSDRGGFRSACCPRGGHIGPGAHGHRDVNRLVHVSTAPGRRGREP